MDISAVLHFITNHNEALIGVFLFLAFLTGILILLVPAPEGSDMSGLNLKEIEAMLRRLVGQGGISAAPHADGVLSDDDVIIGPDGNPVASAGGGGSAGASSDPELQKRLQERELQLKVLEGELANAKALLGKAQSQTPAADPKELDALKAKVKDLETRLKEYEIIEDDIADLSKYKEENAKLKAELESLKEGGASPAAAEAAPVAQSAPEPELTAAPLPADDNVEQFADAVEKQSAPPLEVAETIEPTGDDPLAGVLDTAKMLEEVALLPAETAEGDALAESLDTDKLMAEMGGMEEPAGVDAGITPDPIEPAAAPAPEPVTVSASESDDDLMSEFKDLAKGS